MTFSRGRRSSGASVAAPGFFLCAGGSPLFWRFTHCAASACESLVAHPLETPEKWGGGANRSAQKESWRATRPNCPRGLVNEFPQRVASAGDKQPGQRTKKIACLSGCHTLNG
jgi:hypothetical protein